MISAVFIDRPRLAMVIAFIITITGGLALTQIPVAQFPDIVPPQVTGRQCGFDSLPRVFPDGAGCSKGV
jgi:hypothetical protein